MRKRIALALAAGSLLLAAPVSARAATIVFSDRSAFEAATTASLGFESFETAFASDPVSVSFAGFSLTHNDFGAIHSLDSATASSFGISNAITHGSRAAAYDEGGFQTLTFTFGAPINAFGLDLVADQDATVDLLGSTVHLTANQPVFFGAINTGGLFDIVELGSGGATIIGFDAVAFGVAEISTVPEPATASLLVLGIAGLITRRHRNRSVVGQAW